MFIVHMKAENIRPPVGHSRQSNNCKSLIMNENIFTTPFLLETGFCFYYFHHIKELFSFLSRDGMFALLSRLLNIALNI